MIQMTQPFEYDEKFIEENAEEVTLNEGDFLYHPAGIWHSVKSNEDSVSINFSLKNLTMADFMSDSLRHLMY